MDAALKQEVENWIADDPDPATALALTELVNRGDEATLRKYFSGFLQFGTAGLRGPNGPGPSCMNRAVVARAAAGIAAYKSANLVRLFIKKKIFMATVMWINT